MDKTIIAQMAHNMENREDLLHLLNSIKQSEMAEEGMGDKYHPFSLRQLTYYCNSNHTFHRYHQFKIRKKKPGEFRTISAPRNTSFMVLLRYVNEILKAIYKPSEYAFGFTEGRSVVDNALRHKGMNYVFNTDIKDFFPSIDQARVWKRLQLSPFNFPDAIARLLAGLCSMRTETIVNIEKGYYRCVLPQGAPTSPIITNMICDNLDRRLAGLAKRFGLNYSRYADDITFSSMHNVYQDGGEFRKELKRIIEGQNFKMNEAKTRLQKRGVRQEVTGIIVNEKLNVTQKYVRDIRNVLFIWERYGINAAILKFFPKYKSEKGHVKKGNPDMVNVLDGKLMYLKMVKGESDSVYQRLHNKFEQLSTTLSDPDKTTERGVTYVETHPVLEFEKEWDTQIIIMPETEKEIVKMIDHDIVSKKMLKVRHAYFQRGKTKYKVSINKSITKEELGHKESLSISNCRDAKGKQFWLLHRSSKVFKPKTLDNEIGLLLEDLDKLLK